RARQTERSTLHARRAHHGARRGGVSRGRHECSGRAGGLPRIDGRGHSSLPRLRGGPHPEAGRVSLLFDQNLSRRLPALLLAEYPGSEQVVVAGLSGADDRAVWAYAAAHGLAIVSKDADFQQLAATRGPPRKVIWLRV